MVEGYTERELGFTGGDPETLHYDNIATIHIASNPIYHELMKHVRLDCHLVLEKVTKQIVYMIFSYKMFLMDIYSMFCKFSLVDIASPTWGRVLRFI